MQKRIRLLCYCLLPAVFVCIFCLNIHAGDILANIGDSALVDRNVKNTVELLRNEISTTSRRLPPGLMKEFENSIAARLKAIQETVSQNISKEYKSALMAKRLLELAEHVMTLPYRAIPENAQQRKEAQHQYAAVLDRFEKGALERMSQTNELSRSVIGGALRQILTDVQQDIFRPGYGQPLNDQEMAELNRIVDGMLQAVPGLRETSDKKGSQALGLREVAKVANDGRKAVLDFLRGRETALANDASFVANVNAWHNKNAAIEKAVDRHLESADQTEISAITEHAREIEKKDILENDPRRMDEREAAKARGRRSLFIGVLATLFIGGLAAMIKCVIGLKRKSLENG